jgi:hypothetical protein
MLDHSALLPIFIDSSSKLCDKFSQVGKHQVVLNARIPDKNIVTPKRKASPASLAAPDAEAGVGCRC